MSQAIKINESPAAASLSAAEFTDLVLKSHVAVDAIKKENEENTNSSSQKTRRGKKNELMPTGGKVVNLRDFAEQPSASSLSAPVTKPSNNPFEQGGDDPMNGTSIYFRLASLFVNDLMQVNQEEMSAQAVALQANQKAMQMVQDGYSKLEDDTSAKVKQNHSRAKKWTLGGALGGIAGVLLGVAIIIAAVALIPVTGGLSMGAVVVGGLLTAGSVALTITAPTLVAEDKKNPGSVSMMSAAIDDSPADPAKLAANQAMTSLLNSLSSTANNNTSRDTQNLQNVNSLQQQYSSMFSQTISQYSSSMSNR